MTSCIRKPWTPRRPAAPARRAGSAVRAGGFTLAELVVVIGIILILIGILLPSIGRAYHQAVRSRMQLDLQAISTALDAYKHDFGYYPPVFDHNPLPGVANVGALGAYSLCRALIAPEDDPIDGADGPGFRTRRDLVTGKGVGRVRGPYLDLSRFKITVNSEIADRYGKPILYYPANPAAKTATTDPGSPFQFVGTDKSLPRRPDRPYYNAADNDFYLEVEKLRRIVGARDDGHIYAPSDFVPDPPGGPPTPAIVPAWTGPYLLISAGPDQEFGPPDKAQKIWYQNRCDDVTNYSRSEY